MAEISFCGQVCAECPVYQSTRENDQGQRLWLSFEYSSPDHQYQPEDMHCTGCHSQAELEYRNACLIINRSRAAELLFS